MRRVTFLLCYFIQVAASDPIYWTWPEQLAPGTPRGQVSSRVPGSDGLRNQPLRGLAPDAPRVQGAPETLRGQAGPRVPGPDRLWSQPLRRQALDLTRVQKTLGSLPVNRSRGPGANSTYSRTSGPAPSGLAPGKPCGRRCASSWHPLSFHPVAHATPLRASLAQRATC